MSLPLPNLDDRPFQHLVEELRTHTTRYAPGWTDHNLSDPGITLLELLAWLSETVLYRLNRIPDQYYQNFLLLTGHSQPPAQAARAEVVFQLSEAQPHAVFIPRGTRLAAAGSTVDPDILFAVTGEIRIPAGQTEARGDALNIYRLQNEHLGTGNGRSFQSFQLKYGPLFLASDNELSYFNPKVKVRANDEEEEWSLVNDLLKSAPEDRYFAVNAVFNEIRFGNTNFGRIPPRGAEIICTSYYRAGGSVGNVAAGKIDRIMEKIQGIEPGKITVSNPEPTSGGADPEPLDRVLSRAAANLHKRYRAVSASDFETLAIEANPGTIARAKCLVNRNLEGTTSSETGHISILVVPKAAPGEYRPVPGDELKEEIRNYLLTRRLITTRVHVIGPEYLEMAVHFNVKAKPNIEKDLLETRVRKRLQSFLHPISGGIDGKGWPFGRDVVISEIYRLIEETPGVDYTVGAQLIPFAQFVNLFFAAPGFEQSLPPGLYVEKKAAGKYGTTRFPIVELRPPDESNRKCMVVKGFKQGDRVVITHKHDPYLHQYLPVKSVSGINWKELGVDSFQVDKPFPRGSKVSTEDNRIKSTLSREIFAGGEVDKIEITGFSQKDVIDVIERSADNTENKVVVENITLTGIERCTDRVWLEENWLPWYVESTAHSAGRAKSPLEKGVPKGRGVSSSRLKIKKG
jgi:hypothetical protein